ncbi:MAG TPA: BON domain-containing protein [Albitalea sp.]|jgi:osmotically-inducible protein OsmY|nr:BON domain-containing protein [Albitalea sp.]
MANATDVTKVLRAAFEIDPRVDLHRFPIHVVHNGKGVILQGEVENIAAKRVALQLAHRLSGMTQVIDALRLVPSEPRGDGEIRDAFVRALRSQPELRNCSVRQHHKGQLQTVFQTDDDAPSGAIDFAVTDGALTIDGDVISLSHKRVVEALGWWTPGCRDVVNRLNVVPHEEDNDDELADAIRLVLEMDPLVHADRIGIKTESGVVTLAGVLGRPEERHMAEMDAWAVCGVTDVQNRIEVSS